MAQLPRRTKNSPHSILRYTTMATQMAITIFLGVWLGLKADEHWSPETPIFTMVGSLIGVVVAIYMVIRDVMKK